MKTWLRKLTDKQELILILILIFGLGFFSSTYEFILFIINHKNEISNIGTWDLVFNSVGQIVLALIAFLILYVRGHKMEQYKLKFERSNIPIGIGLYFLTMIGMVLLGLLLYTINPNQMKAEVSYSGNFYILPITLIINSFYEEFFLNNYLYHKFSHWRWDQIFSFSVILRASYHTYQGLQGFLFLIVFGVILTGYYSKTKKLWPLVIAHTLFNLTSFFLEKLVK